MYVCDRENFAEKGPPPPFPRKKEKRKKKKEEEKKEEEKRRKKRRKKYGSANRGNVEVLVCHGNGRLGVLETSAGDHLLGVGDEMRLAT